MNIVQNGPTWLIVDDQFAGIAPDDLLRWFLEPDKIARWWTSDSRVDARVGGAWVMDFPQMGDALVGEIALIAPTSLVVSWTFASEPANPPRMCHISTAPAADGALLTIVHGPYRPNDHFTGDDQDRAGHLEGWTWFLGQLQDAISNEAGPR